MHKEGNQGIYMSNLVPDWVPNDLQWVVADWLRREMDRLVSGFKEVLFEFELLVYEEPDPGSDTYTFYITNKEITSDQLENLHCSIFHWWDEHGREPVPADLNFDFEWQKVSFDWKSEHGAGREFTEAAGYFGVNVYQTPFRKKYLRYAVTRHNLSDEEVKKLEAHYFSGEVNSSKEIKVDYKALASRETMKKVTAYHRSLAEGEMPGKYFKKRLANLPVEKLSEAEFLEIFVNTKKLCIYPESSIWGDGTDWNQRELSILGDISIGIPVTIYDDGRHLYPQTHKNPFKGTLLFTPRALLSSYWGDTPADWEEVVNDGKIDPEGYYRLYERRLLPCLIYANKKAKENDCKAFITIPYMGGGYFAGEFNHQLSSLLKGVLKKLLVSHISKLEHIRAVYFEPHRENENERHQIGHISFLARYFSNKDDKGKPQLCHPETYEEEEDDFSDCELFSIVDWDHVSWPGNDFYSGSRRSDDGVKAAATNFMEGITGIKGYYKEGYKYLPPAPYHTWRQVIEALGLEIMVKDKLMVFCF